MPSSHCEPAAAIALLFKGFIAGTHQHIYPNRSSGTPWLLWKSMKPRFIILILAVTLVWLLGWFAASRFTKPRSEPESVIQGRTTRDWLREAETGGFPDYKNHAFEVLLSAGLRVVPDLSQVLLAPEPLKDLALRLPNEIMPVDKKYHLANGSEMLTLKAHAAEVLGVIAYRNPDAPEVIEAIPSLISALRNGSPIVRYFSAQALGAAGKAASKALPALIARTTDADSGLRMSAVEAIGRIGVNTPAAIAAITQALSDTNRDVSTIAMQTLQVLQKLPPDKNTKE